MGDYVVVRKVFSPLDHCLIVDQHNVMLIDRSGFGQANTDKVWKVYPSTIVRDLFEWFSKSLEMGNVH